MTSAPYAPASLQSWFEAAVAKLSAPDRQALTSQWNQLTTQQQTQVAGSFAYGARAPNLSTLQTAIQGATSSGTSAYAPQAVKPAATSAPTSPPAAVEKPPTDSGAATPASATTGTPEAGTPAASQLLSQYFTTPAEQGAPGGSPQGIAEMSGLDYNSAHTQYQAYVANFAAAQARLNATSTGARPTAPPTKPMTETQFIQGLAQASYGIWAPAIDMLSYTFQQQTGQAMPPALAQQITAGFKALDPNSQQQVQLYMLSAIQSIENANKTASGKGGQTTEDNLTLNISPFLQQLSTYAPTIYSTSSGGAPGNMESAGANSIIGAYMTANPIASQEAAAEKGKEELQATDLLTQYGVPDTAANIASLSTGANYANVTGMITTLQNAGDPITSAIVASLVANGGDPNGASNIPGMTWEQETTAITNMTSLWKEYFGKPPTTQQIQSMGGWTADELNTYVMNSPSSVAGVTNQQYKDYVSAFNDDNINSTHIFSSGIDEALIKDFHDAVVTPTTVTVGGKSAPNVSPTPPTTANAATTPAAA